MIGQLHDLARRRDAAVPLVAILAGFVPGLAAEPHAAPEYFRDIAPLVRQYCAGCHNDIDFKGDVTLERFADLQDGGFGSGTMLKPGDPDGSELVRLITGKAKEPMPPADEPQLAPEEIGTIRRWIAAGAKGPGKDEDVSILSFLEVPEIAPAEADPAITAADVSPDGKRLALARYGTVEVRAIGGKKTAESLHLAGLPGKVNAVHFAPGESRRLVTASGIAGLKGVAAIWDLASGKVLREFGEGFHRDILYDAEFSPDGSLLATAGYDARIALWEAASGKRLRIIEVHNGAIFDLAFSPDGTILASASADETVKLWQVATGRRLDTLNQPQGEQFSVAFTPDGKFVLAGGADNRIRLWRVVSTDMPGINPLRQARFAHEEAVVKLAVSPDGRFLVSSGDDRTVKQWTLPGLQPVRAWEGQPDVAPGLAFAGQRAVIAGRMDGSVRRYQLEAARGPAKVSAERPGHRAAVGSADGDALPRLAAEESPEPVPVRLPVAVSGVIGSEGDADAFRFAAKAGEQWVLEVKAARMKSPLDSKVEVVAADGSPVERVRLQAVRDSWFEFRGKDSTTSNDFRVFNWREMELNEFLYCNGEVVKLWLYPRGPDSGFMVYPGFGARHTWFGTTAQAHALGEPCSIVQPLPPGADPVPNGLPVYTIYYENDDDPQRRLGSDSKLTFTAPADGEYLARISDVRGFGGDEFRYELTIRRPRPDFEVALDLTKGVTLHRGSGREFVLTARRLDGFDGEIRVDLPELPPGIAATSPVVIEAGQHRAMGVLFAEPGAPAIDDATASPLRATATIGGTTATRESGSFGELALAEDPPKLQVEILPDGESGAPRIVDGVLELTIHPGETITAVVKAERRDFKERIEFGKEDAGRNLAHGLIIDNIGLNGLMIPAGQNEQRFFITAADWVPESTRHFHLRTNAAGKHATRPIVLHVRKR